MQNIKNSKCEKAQDMKPEIHKTWKHICVKNPKPTKPQPKRPLTNIDNERKTKKAKILAIEDKKYPPRQLQKKGGKCEQKPKILQKQKELHKQQQTQSKVKQDLKHQNAKKTKRQTKQ